MKYLITYGDPIDGFTFIGPFDTREDADVYLADCTNYDDTRDVLGQWIAFLEPPLYSCDFGAGGIDYRCPRHLRELFAGPDKPTTRIDDYVVVDTRETDARCEACEEETE